MLRRVLTAAAGVAVLALALAACGGSANRRSSSVNAAGSGYGSPVTGSLPAVGTPAHGGTITVGQLTNATPTDILPLIDVNTCSTATVQFISNQYIPLYYGPDGGQPKIDESLSAAEPPVYSNHDQTVTIRIKPGLKWSDGSPVNAQDVVFYLDLLKVALEQSPANWCQYSPGNLPANLQSWTTQGSDTVVLQLKAPVNPSWFTADQLQDVDGGIYPLPAQAWDVASSQGAKVTDWATNPADALKIYAYLRSQGEAAATFASSPLWKVVDGPFRLKHFDATDGSYDLVPNPSYGLTPKPRAGDIAVRTYPSRAAMTQAMDAGTVDVGALDAGAGLASIPGLRRHRYSVFGAPGWGWFGGIINFHDATNDFDKVVAQPYIRGVFAELVNQKDIVKRVFHGWAVADFGPVPTAPGSAYVPAAAAGPAWPYDPAKAVATLKAHGWEVRPGGQTVCVRPGHGADRCGAGIRRGTPIKFVWANPPASTSPVGSLEAQLFAREAKGAAGIQVQLVSQPFSVLIANYDNQNPASARYANDWGVNDYGGVYTEYYPTGQGILSLGGSLNLGSYDDPQADRLMAASVSSPSPAAITSEVSYLAKSYPVFYMPDPDLIFAVSRRIGGPQSAFLAMALQQSEFQFLYLNARRR